MKWYWYVIFYLIIEFILYMTVNYIAKKKGCYEIMKTISDREAKEEYKILYYGISFTLFALLVIFEASYVWLIVVIVIILILAPFCSKLATLVKAMDMKERNVKVDYSVSGKEKNREDAKEDIKNAVTTVGLYSILSGTTKRKKK